MCLSDVLSASLSESVLFLSVVLESRQAALGQNSQFAKAPVFPTTPLNFFPSVLITCACKCGTTEATQQQRVSVHSVSFVSLLTVWFAPSWSIFAPLHVTILHSFLLLFAFLLSHLLSCYFEQFLPAFFSLTLPLVLLCSILLFMWTKKTPL